MSTTPEPMSEDWIVDRACPEHKHLHMKVFRWGPPPYHPCPNCSYKQVLETVHIEGNVPSVPMAEKRLAEIEANVKTWTVDALMAKWDLEAVSALLAEVRRLRNELICPDRQQLRREFDGAVVLASNRLAEIEGLRRSLNAAHDLLLERARQAEELQRAKDADTLEIQRLDEEVARYRTQRDEALAQLAEYRTRIEYIENNYQHSEDCPLNGYVEGEEDDAGTPFPKPDCDCSTGALTALLQMTPARALELQRARREVVEAAKRSREFERQLAIGSEVSDTAREEAIEADFEASIDAVKEAVDALARLEAGR